MARIGTVGRTGKTTGRPAQSVRAGTVPVASTDEIPPVRALVVLDGGRGEERATYVAPIRLGAGRPNAGFVAQLLVTADPTLKPSRQERTRMAAARYGETARRLA